MTPNNTHVCNYFFYRSILIRESSVRKFKLDMNSVSKKEKGYKPRLIFEIQLLSKSHLKFVFERNF